jgi:hypothetical protein
LTIFGEELIQADQGTSPQYFLTISRKKKFLRNLTKIADDSISIIMGLYKVAYWLKSGPFLAKNRSRPIKGQAPNISWQFRGKKIPSIFD